MILALLLMAGTCLGAISNNTAWEVRGGVGSDNNGGGFVVGSTGTDRSQSNTPFCSATDLVLASSTTMTSVTCPFSSASVGNIIQITAGTGFTAGFYQVVSVATSTATVDRTAGTGGSTAGTFALGGALATIAKAFAAMTTSNIIFVKASATYVTTANLMLPNATNLTPSPTQPPNQLVGYTISRSDGGRATIQLNTTSGLKGIDGSNAGGWYISNIVMDCNSLGTSTGIYLNAVSVIRNSLVKNCTTAPINLNFNYSTLMDSEITGNTSSAIVNGTGCLIIRNYIHGNTATGLTQNGNIGSSMFNVIANNTGASSDGIQVGNYPNHVVANTIYNNGRDGLRFQNNNSLGESTVRDNLFVNNAGYGMNGYQSGAGWGSFPQFDGNAYYNNTLGNRTNSSDTSTIPINAANPYTSSLDVILTANPFTNAAGGDFTLNAAAGGGAAAKGAGTPGGLPGLSPIGAMSFGVYQPASSSGGAGFKAAYAE